MRQSRSTPCFEEQDIFDRQKESGQIGNYRPRPRCDKDGFYEPIRCVSGQTCHCLNQDGARIFGEAFETEAIEFFMKCGGLLDFFNFICEAYSNYFQSALV